MKGGGGAKWCNGPARLPTEVTVLDTVVVNGVADHDEWATLEGRKRRGERWSWRRNCGLLASDELGESG